MSPEHDPLLRRQAQLLARSRRLRDHIDTQLVDLTATPVGIEQRLARAGRGLSHPITLALGIGVLMLLGRRYPLKALVAGYGLLSTALRLRKALSEHR
jgi:hypothetical protein